MSDEDMMANPYWFSEFVEFQVSAVKVKVQRMKNNFIRTSRVKIVKDYKLRTVRASDLMTQGKIWTSIGLHHVFFYVYQLQFKNKDHYYGTLPLSADPFSKSNILAICKILNFDIYLAFEVTVTILSVIKSRLKMTTFFCIWLQFRPKNSLFSIQIIGVRKKSNRLKIRPTIISTQDFTSLLFYLLKLPPPIILSQNTDIPLFVWYHISSFFEYYQKF